MPLVVGKLCLDVIVDPVQPSETLQELVDFICIMEVREALPFAMVAL